MGGSRGGAGGRGEEGASELGVRRVEGEGWVTGSEGVGGGGTGAGAAGASAAWGVVGGGGVGGG